MSKEEIIENLENRLEYLEISQDKDRNEVEILKIKIGNIQAGMGVRLQEMTFIKSLVSKTEDK